MAKFEWMKVKFFMFKFTHKLGYFLIWLSE